MRLYQRGFTLIELLVVIGILGILLIGLLMAFNPIEQLNKARDGKRESEFQTIKSALDTYYNDHGCYPTSVNFGYPWTSGSTTYLRLVPQDPSCGSASGLCYAYQTDGSTCPQWNVLYAKLQSSTAKVHACALASLTQGNTAIQCLPSNYTSLGYNYCAFSGNIDCSIISQGTIQPSGQGQGQIIITPGPSPTPTPRPSPTPVPTDTCTPRLYGCAPAIVNNQSITICKDMGIDPQTGQGAGSFCGYPGCQGNACCNYACTQ